MTQENFEYPDIWSFLRAQQERRLVQQEEVISLLTVPVPEELLNRVLSLQTTEREAVLRRHPGYKLKKMIDSLWAMEDVFLINRNDVLCQMSEFDNFSRSTEMYSLSGEKRLKEIENKVSKEVVAFVATAMSLVDLSRRLLTNINIPGFSEKREEVFDDYQHKFLTSLRNFMMHQTFPSVNWQITRNVKNKEGSSDFLVKLDFFEVSELNGKAKAFYKRSGESGVSLKELVINYSERVQVFYSWLRVEMQLHLPIEVTDYEKIFHKCKSVSFRDSYRFQLKQFIERNIDPYAHLHKYLEKSKIEEALRLPMNSKTQVDFLIKNVDKYNSFDEELRQLAYQLFKVK